jgi:hypothetical protein
MTTRNRGKLDSARSTRFFSNESTISVDGQVNEFLDFSLHGWIGRIQCLILFQQSPVHLGPPIGFAAIVQGPYRLVFGAPQTQQGQEIESPDDAVAARRPCYCQSVAQRSVSTLVVLVVWSYY